MEEGTYQTLSGAVIYCHGDMDGEHGPLVLGPCKYREEIQPLAAGGQLLGLRRDLMFLEDDSEILHVVPQANVKRLELHPSKIARVN